jgi:hypothetical protein
MDMRETKEEPANSESGETITYVWYVIQTKCIQTCYARIWFC